MEIGSIFDIPIVSLFNENENENANEKVIFPFENDYVYKDRKFFNTGRSAIEFLFKYCIKEFESEVLVPDYICNSVLDAIERAGCKYKMYSITKEFDIDINDLKNKISKKTKAILFLNYFGGTISKNTADKLLEFKKRRNYIN